MRWYFALSLAALVLAGGPFLVVAAAHVAYPGYTEPMECDVLQHVERAARGEPLAADAAGVVRRGRVGHRPRHHDLGRLVE